MGKGPSLLGLCLTLDIFLYRGIPFIWRNFFIYIELRLYFVDTKFWQFMRLFCHNSKWTIYYKYLHMVLAHIGARIYLKLCLSASSLPKTLHFHPFLCSQRQVTLFVCKSLTYNWPSPGRPFPVPRNTLYFNFITFLIRVLYRFNVFTVLYYFLKNVLSRILREGVDSTSNSLICNQEGR
jgi:hypothetical protein